MGLSPKKMIILSITIFRTDKLVKHYRNVPPLRRCGEIHNLGLKKYCSKQL